MLHLSLLSLLKAHLPLYLYSASYGLSDLFCLANLLLFMLVGLNELFLLLYYHPLVLPAFRSLQIGEFSLILELVLLESLRSIVVLHPRLQISTLKGFQSLRILLSFLLEQHLDLLRILLYLIFLLPSQLVIDGLVVDLLILYAKGRNPAFEHVDMRLLLVQKHDSHGVIDLLDALTIAAPWRP